MPRYIYLPSTFIDMVDYLAKISISKNFKKTIINIFYCPIATYQLRTIGNET